MNFDDPTLLLLISGVSIASLLLGFIFCMVFSKQKIKQNSQQLQEGFDQKEQMINDQLDAAKSEVNRLSGELSELHKQQLDAQRYLGELSQRSEQLGPLLREKQEWQTQAQNAQQKVADLRTSLEAQSAKYEQEQLAYKEKIQLLESAEKRLQEQFENLANKIFEQKNEKFSQHSKAGLDAILTPLKEQIEGFKKQVTDQYVKEGQERASLKTEILGLKELNQQITEEASALTKALKGDNKQQGNWGEVVLDRILKESGLREGHEFDTQVSLKNADGKLYQPDVVVHLPNEKDIVVDSKMSLAAYEKYFNEQEDEASRQRYLSEHLTSVKNHIKELGKKDYQDLQGIRTLDYVLMFIPVESAFLLAIDQAPELYKLALDNNIMLVSPTNLLIALRTINHIWQNERQSQNAQDIAARAADMYDKFVAFTLDMEGLGNSLGSVQKKFDGAMNKLTTGRGNLVKRAADFKKLGVQSNKQLDPELIEKSNQNDGK